jgi:oligosaccharide translocation protein RFT1
MASLGSTARSLILLQLLSRVLTFSLNQLLVRIASPSVFGTAAVQFDLVLSTLLFLSREGVRLTVLRAPKGDASISEAQVTSLSLLPLPVSLGLSVVLVPLYLRSMPSTTTSQSSFHLALGTYILAAMLELCIEPLYNTAQRAGRVNLRVKAEGAAVIARAIATVTLVGFGGEQWALRGFAIGQLSYALCLMAIFGWEFRSSLAQIYVPRNENAYVIPDTCSYH